MLEVEAGPLGRTGDGPVVQGLVLQEALPSSTVPEPISLYIWASPQAAHGISWPAAGFRALFKARWR